MANCTRFPLVALFRWLSVRKVSTPAPAPAPAPAPTPFVTQLKLALDPLQNVSYHIDCGGSTNTTDQFNVTWLSDHYYTGGATSVVSRPLHFSLLPEKTLRFFPPTTSGKKNCYVIPVTSSKGRYLFRTFTVYDNYDGKNHMPSFEVSVQNTVVFSYKSPWPESISSDGGYSDLLAFVDGTEANVCFYSIATDPPIIGTLEVIEIDPTAYDSATVGNDSVLVNYARLSCGQDQWGPGFSNDTDFFSRSWDSDAKFRSSNIKGISVITTTNDISGVNQKPNYFPLKLYQSGVTLSSDKGVLEYELSVDAKLDYLLWFHFAEMDPRTTKAGQRVFDVLINGANVNRIDVFKAAGGRLKAYSWHYVAKNLSSTTLTVKLNPVVGVPILNGLENYAIVPADLATVPEQVVAMRALKESLRVPDRMGWNGDPCAPATWDAWEGVTCRANKEGNALVISQINLGSQGLKGYISDKISLLTNLASLNLSSNSLTGTLPEGLGQQSLVNLDLSYNEFTGPIPESFASSTNLRLVLLNDNQLEGRVPDKIYSVGVHGGAIERKRNDYDFGLPHELMSMAAKRNKYQRQKSLMDLEMESQHAKGLMPSRTLQ
ncbi:hypothetical protein KSS87_020649 [Heliosperma pusillum]|nr:hypothetical protein KSS87_020649 [Heliosperma pusillum]